MSLPFPIGLSIAGFDGSGGAGLQADMKTFSALGVYASTVLTSLPVQNTTGVKNVYDLPLESISEQIDSILEDLDVTAIKIGMLHKPDIIELVASKLENCQAQYLVVDPVMVAKSGHRLLREDAIQALKEYILPIADVLTPNLPEAEDLLGIPLSGISDLSEYKTRIESAGKAILEIGRKSTRIKLRNPNRAVVIKGGHSQFSSSQDCLIQESGNVFWFSSPRIESNNTHGTGCTFSAAVAAELAKGNELELSIQKAKDYLTRAMSAGKNHKIGKGKGPVHFFFRAWEKEL